MMRSLVCAVLACASLAATACGDEPPAASGGPHYVNATGDLEPEQKRWIVTPGAIGPLHVGMTAAEVGKAVGDSTLAGAAARSSCTYLRPRKVPRGVSLMMSEGRLVRIDVDSSGVLTDSGLQVGDSEVAVMVMFSGRVRVDADRYRPAPAHVLTVSVPGDNTTLMVFTTDGSSVTSYRTGRRGAVELVERCG